jgi:hypothetical protein
MPATQVAEALGLSPTKVVAGAIDNTAALLSNRKSIYRIPIGTAGRMHALQEDRPAFKFGPSRALCQDVICLLRYRHGWRHLLIYDNILYHKDELLQEAKYLIFSKCSIRRSTRPCCTTA